MPDRRSVLALMAAALGLPFAGPAAAFVAPVPKFHPKIGRVGRHFIVNGWILTVRDLELLGLNVD